MQRYESNVHIDTVVGRRGFAPTLIALCRALAAHHSTSIENSVGVLRLGETGLFGFCDDGEWFLESHVRPARVVFELSIVSKSGIILETTKFFEEILKCKSILRFWAAGATAQNHREQRRTVFEALRNVVEARGATGFSRRRLQLHTGVSIFAILYVGRSWSG